jgi:hypothetical protein
MRDFCHGASVIGYFTAVVNGFLTARDEKLAAVISPHDKSDKSGEAD